MGEKRALLTDRWFIDQVTAVTQQFLRSLPDRGASDTPGPSRTNAGPDALTARAARLSAERARLEEEEAALQADVERLNHAHLPHPGPPSPRPVPAAGPGLDAETLTLAEAGRIRRAYKITEAALPRLVLEAAEDGRDASAIARDLAVTPSYVYRILRERVRYTWRVDVLTDKTWAERGTGHAVVDRALGSKAALAEKVLAETAAPHPARVLVWEGRRTADEDAAHTLTRPEPGP
ncbi:hypothetical protein [Streptomyces sp. NPDC017529]|uniref:hypothetical protein n=1 Tax=Streptomyces sp. NPDC017529 TaxID=3365000 RepID=UPI003789EC6B